MFTGLPIFYLYTLCFTFFCLPPFSLFYYFLFTSIFSPFHYFLFNLYTLCFTIFCFTIFCLPLYTLCFTIFCPIPIFSLFTIFCLTSILSVYYILFTSLELYMLLYKCWKGNIFPVHWFLNARPVNKEYCVVSRDCLLVELGELGELWTIKLCLNLGA